MNPYLWTAYFCLAFLLQAVFSPLLAPLNLTVVLVGLFGRAAAHHFTDQHGFSSHHAEYAASSFGMLCGFVEDLLAGGLLGPGMLAKALIGYLSAVVFSDVLFRWIPVFGGLTMILFTVLDWGCALGARVAFGTAATIPFATFQPLVVQCIGNGIVGMMIRPGRFGIA